MNTTPNKQSYPLPLFVDLDGTLTRSDILFESFFELIKSNPLYVFLVLYWAINGKAYLKQKIADKVDIDASILPYQSNLVEYLHHEYTTGRKIYLATASNKKYAQIIAQHFGIFTDIIASSTNINMSGKRKLAAIKEVVGDGEFEYAANSMVDMPIWEHSQTCILVNPSRKTERLAKHRFIVTHIFKDQPANIGRYFSAIRIHQWMKNILLFLPLLTAHKINEAGLIVDTLFGAIAFSFCASSVYILNDLLDLSADRNHSRKRKRPFASGDIQLLHGVLMIPVLLLLSLLIAAFLSEEFLVVLIFYFLVTLAYSFALKRIVLIDVLVLAGLYVIRVIAGSAVSGISLSFWLLAFSMFIFLSLALAKRSAELVSLRRDEKNNTVGRGYIVQDLDYLHSMGTASGYMSVLVMALYINSPNVMALYPNPEIIWLICPTLLYWISRVWLKTGRGEMPDDPLVFAFKDRQSQILSVIVAIITISATNIS